MIWAAGIAALLTLMNSAIAWRLSVRYQCASVADIFWPLHHLVSITNTITVIISVSVISYAISICVYGFTRVSWEGVLFIIYSIVV